VGASRETAGVVQLIQRVGDISDDEAAGLALVSQHSAGTAPAQPVRVAGSSMEGVCKVQTVIRSVSCMCRVPSI
jgi:hypothetical protein